MSFTPRVEGIAAVLQGARLVVPEYQRPFSWSETQVEDLWDDLVGAIQKGADEYFLGSIVLSKTEQGDLEVVDGQQRLATVSLLVAAIVDIFESRSDERAAEIRRDLLGKKHVVTRQVTQNLKLNAVDNELFRQLTLVPSSQREVDAPKESQKLLLRAFELLKSRLQEEVNGLGADDWQVPLTRWFEFLGASASILQLITEDENRAFVIFETLNDRGVGLNTSDLLRNHIFGHADHRIGEVRSAWTTGFAAVSPDGDPERSDNFLKHWWASRTGVVRVKGLYKTIKPTVKDSQSAVDFAKWVEAAGPLWAAMYDRDSSVWARHPEGSVDAIEVLQRLNVEQCRPLLLAALQSFGPVDAKKVFRLVLNWSIRWIVSGGGGGGTVERLYATTARDLSARTISSVTQMADAFMQHVPSDRQFENAFATKPVRQGWLARYFLRALERQAAKTAEPELVPNANVEEVNLEHVLPRNPGAEWAVQPEDLAVSVLLIGNQALLRKSHNTRIGNESFSIKKPILAASDLRLTKEIGAMTDWTPQRILERSERLAKLAVLTWPRV